MTWSVYGTAADPRWLYFVTRRVRDGFVLERRSGTGDDLTAYFEQGSRIYFERQSA